MAEVVSVGPILGQDVLVSRLGSSRAGQATGSLLTALPIYETLGIVYLTGLGFLPLRG